MSKIEDIKMLRQKTGAGLVEVKNALDEAGGDQKKAEEILRIKGQAKSAKRSQNKTGEGLVHSYIHSNGQIGVLVQVNCETDFVARSPEFKDFCHQIAMHIAAMNPDIVSRDQVAEDKIEDERRILTEKARKENKPDNIIEKIVDGQINKWLKEIALEEQVHVNEARFEGKTCGELRQELSVKTGENITIESFSRLQV